MPKFRIGQSDSSGEFLKQGIPIECAFLRLDGFNDNEYENLKTL